MILCKNKKEIDLDKTETQHKDLLLPKRNMRVWEFILIVVYLSVGGRGRNSVIKKGTERILQSR